MTHAARIEDLFCRSKRESLIVQQISIGKAHAQQNDFFYLTSSCHFGIFCLACWMLSVAACAAAVPGGGHASERAGLSPTTTGGSGSHSAKDQPSSPELQKDLRLRMQQHHPVDVIISDRDRFVFVDNVKAASTTLRELLSEELNVTWWDGCDGVYRQCCSTLSRTTSACLNEQHANYFVFGFARHPAVKFESGAPVV